MAVLLDSGIVYAYYDRSDRWHAAAKQLCEVEAGGLLLPSVVAAEVDHLLGVRLGGAARRLFYRGLVAASFLLVELPQQRLARVIEIDAEFAELEIGFVDATLVALAESLRVPRVATADRRHFDPLARRYGLELVPQTPVEPAARSSTTDRVRASRPRRRGGVR